MLIKVREVVKMKIPFPNISSTLAIQEHMYICVADGSKKQFVKCQTYKPLHHAKKNVPPFKYIIEKKNLTRNPFDKPETIIDLDKLFLAQAVRFNRCCLTTNRCDICKGLYNQITNGIQNNTNIILETLDSVKLKQLNSFIR